MSSIEILPFSHEHVPLIGDAIPPELARAYETAGPCQTVKVGDISACAMGLVMLSKHTAEAWLLVNDDARHRFAKIIIKESKTFLDISEISHSIHRIQIAIEFSKASFVRWSKLLGFEMEGLMRSYDDSGRDHFLMARVRHE